MTTTEERAPIRVSGPAGLLAAVPPMLGFHPTNSLVLMCLSGGRRRVGPVARVDLPIGHDRSMAAHLARHALNHADEVVVICYQDSRRRPALLDDLLGELAKVGMDVVDAIMVRAGRARPALNAAMERAHRGIAVPGADDPTVMALNAAGALSGRTVLSDREELRRSIAGPTGDRLRQAEAWITTASEGRLPRISPPPPHLSPAAKRVVVSTPIVTHPDTADKAPVHQRGCDGAAAPVGHIPSGAGGLLEHACHQAATTGELTVEVATAVAVILMDLDIRDAVLARAITEMDQAWLPMLISCATWTPAALAPPLCSVLAMVAYRHGDGALAQIAVDRCLVAEPDHPLAHLLIELMSAGIRPEALERIATDYQGHPVHPRGAVDRADCDADADAHDAGGDDPADKES